MFVDITSYDFPLFCIKVAICVVLPPGALHVSMINSLGLGSTTWATSIELSSCTWAKPFCNGASWFKEVCVLQIIPSGANLEGITSQPAFISSVINSCRVVLKYWYAIQVEH